MSSQGSQQFSRQVPNSDSAIVVSGDQEFTIRSKCHAVDGHLLTSHDESLPPGTISVPKFQDSPSSGGNQAIIGTKTRTFNPRTTRGRLQKTPILSQRVTATVVEGAIEGTPAAPQF